MEQGSFDVALPIPGCESVRFHYVKDIQVAAGILQNLMGKNELFAIDTETECLPAYASYPKAALSPHLSKVRLLQVYDGKNAVVFDMKFINDYQMFKPFLEAKRFIGHNASFDLQYFFKNFGVFNMNIGCAMLLAKLMVHATRTDEMRVGLGPLSEHVLKMKVYKEMGKTDWSVPDLTYEQIEYGALDVVCCAKIAEKLAPGLETFKMDRIYKLHKATQHPVAQMQLNGIGFDKERHEKHIVVWREELHDATKELRTMTGLSKITGPQIAEWLEKHLPDDTKAIWPRTETERLKTDAHVFADFDYLPIVKPFTRYQKSAILCSTFGDNLISMCSPETGRLHSSFKIGHARTGRASCSEPNSQQYPRSPSEEDKLQGAIDFRDAFIPNEGNVFVCADFSQIEIRVAAELSRDPAMLKAYSSGMDIHTLTASKISGKPIERISRADRQLAKASNFGMMFGLGAAKFGHYAKKNYGVEVTQVEAEGQVNDWRELYAGYRDWQLKQAYKCKNSMSVVTPVGKVRKLNEDNCYGGSSNTPVQGGAAEIMNHALCRFHMEGRGYDWKLVNSVHDEILVECEREQAPFAAHKLNACMVQAFLDVFPKGITNGLVDARIGDSWGEAK